MIGAAAAYIAGLFFASFFNEPALLVIAVAVLVSALAAGRKNGFRLSDYVMMSAFFGAAIIAFSLYSEFRYKPVAALDGTEGSFFGSVTEAQHYRGDNSLYILKGRINGEISADISFYSDSLYAETGDRIKLEGCCLAKPSKDFLFDSESYYKADGVFLSVSKVENASVIPSEKHSLRRCISDYRERVISDFHTALGKDSGDLLAGMVFGEKQGMDQNVKTAVYRCGIGHILAVSGLHVSAAVFVLMSILKLCRVNRYISFALMEVLLIFLTAMANYPVSAVRAAVMMNFLYAASLFRRQNDTFNSLSWAVLIICVIQPYSVYDSGFILSVAGTLGIGVFAPYMTKNMPQEIFLQRFIAKTALMLCTTLCVFPFSLFYFDETSLISPVTNLFAVPLCAVSMIAGLVYAFTGGAVDILFVSKIINEAVLRLSDILSDLRFTYFAGGSKAIAGGLIICVVMAALVLALFKKREYVCGAVAASLVFLFVFSAVSSISREKSMRVAVLGKGNNAVLVATYGGFAEIIDLSGHYRSAAYVRKYLALNGISSVDTVILTNKVQSTYAGYSTELEYTDIAKWLISGDTPVDTEMKSISYFGDGRITIENGGCSFEIENDAVRICSDKGNLAFSDKKYVSDMPDGLLVIYGKGSAENTGETKKTISLSECNNIEIVLSEKGGCEIRRL